MPLKLCSVQITVPEKPFRKPVRMAACSDSGQSREDEAPDQDTDLDLPVSSLFGYKEGDQSASIACKRGTSPAEGQTDDYLCVRKHCALP